MSKDFDAIYDLIELDDVPTEEEVDCSWLMKLMLRIDPPAKPPLSDLMIEANDKAGDQHE